MLRYITIATVLFSLSCASGGSSADETSDSPATTPDRHRVTIGVTHNGRIEVWYTSEMGPRRQVLNGNLFYEYLAQSGDTASVTVRRLGVPESPFQPHHIPERILVTVVVDSERTQRFMEPQDVGPFSLEVPIP